MVGVERTHISLDKCLAQCLETPSRSIPGKLVGSITQRGLEVSFEGAAHNRVQTIGTDDEVDLAEVCDRFDKLPEPRFDFNGASSLLKQVKKLEATDSGEADTVKDNLCAVEIKRHIRPRLHVERKKVGRLGIISAKKIESAIGKHDPETPRHVSRVLFVQLDFRLRVTLLPKVREIEAGRASPQDGDAHVSISTQAKTPTRRFPNRHVRSVEEHAASLPM